jgi:hypothetical protein
MLEQRLPLSRAIAPWQRPRPIARWREAERYFKRERDRKLEVTLPRVRFLELVNEDELAAD